MAKKPRLSHRQIDALHRIANGMLCWECEGRRDWRTVVSLFRRGLVSGTYYDDHAGKLLTGIAITATGKAALDGITERACRVAVIRL